ncbi:MAG: putative bifunctional diguanylate cyclase/phosphodiesterase [Thermodesulfobacteriota bacterium]
MRLQSKIILLTTPVVVVSMVALGAISCSLLRTATETQAFNAITLFTARTTDQFRSVLAAAHKDVEVIAGSNVLHQYLLTVDDAARYTLLQPPLIRLFSSYQMSNPDYYEMRVLLPDGYEDTRVASAELDNITEEEGDSPVFHAMRHAGAGFFSTFFINPDNGMVSLLVGKGLPLRDPNRDGATAAKTLRGYLAITINTDFLATRLAEFRDDYSTSFFLANGQGHIFYHAGDPAMGRILDQYDPELLRANQSGRFRELAGNGEGYFLSGRQLMDDYFLYSITPCDRLLAASNRLALFTGLASLAAIIIISLLLFIACRRMIVTPVRRLEQAARDFGEGNPGGDELAVNLPADDEIGALSRSFTEMRKNLLASQEQIRQLAYYDFLTGLPNRVMFHDFLQRTLARAQRHGEKVALMFIDLDDFKRINDTLGHKLGDELLKEVAKRLNAATRSSDYLFREITGREPDMVARMGGDEFTVLLTFIRDANDPAVAARRILDDLSSAFFLDGHELYVGVSIGITIYPGDASSPEELIRNADIAMYHAKEAGKNTYQYFSHSMNEAALERLTMESELRRALDQREFLLHYQPLVDADSNRIVGLEALIRWQHPTKGIIPPNTFIPVAEESGLIVSIGEWVLRETVRQIRRWQEEGRRPVPVSINLASPQFRHVAIDRVISTVLRQEEIDPALLKVELTESILLQAEEEAVRMLQAIKDTGVQICLDDFGTGFSSLNYLKRFPIDVLKIDRSFVANIPGDKKDEEISAAIIALGKCLNLAVVAEGVEKKEQYDFLKGKGCDVIQGYYFHKPLPSEAAGDLLGRADNDAG